MLKRQPIAAGRFYPGNAQALRQEVGSWLAKGAPAAKSRPWALMLPHAGYVFCGDVIGKTLAGQELPSRLIILCPNHTGMGAPLSVWPSGEWITPLGAARVDEALAKRLIATGAGYQADVQAHLGEHSIEVLLPFLQSQSPDLSIVPVCVGFQDARFLKIAGAGLASVLKADPGVGLIVSSDMNHYEDEKTTLAKDSLALEKALAADASELLRVVRENNISMCGAAPLALALYAAKDLGRLEVELAAHETSGKASGDLAHSVGYAGLRLYLGAA